MITLRVRSLLQLMIGLAGAIVASRADEGFWLFNAPPRNQLKARHDFELSDAWLDHLMKSSVRLGASASFVSGDGLIITNHHVGRSQLQRLSTAERNLARDGFHARTPAEELKCPGFTASVLQSIEDVTARVTTALAAAPDPASAAAARRKVYAEIAEESLAKTGLQSNVVSLFEGGVYHLYRYKRYNDVRLVFAPESAIAAFGGDADNFEYPRFCLDVCFFRAYENAQPAHPEHFLKWSTAGARDGELVFITGHPGNTDRLLSGAEIEFARDVSLPFTLDGLRRNEAALKLWGARDAENARRAASFLLGIENSRKRAEGQLAALQDAAFMTRIQRAEDEFKRELAARGQTAALAAYDRIAATQREIARGYARHAFLVTGTAFASQAFTLGRTALARPEDLPPGRGGRSGESGPGGRGGTGGGPIYDDLEIVRLAASLARLADTIGYADPTVRVVLAGKAPRARAAELIRGTKLRDADFRRQLREKPADEAAAKDPMVALLRAIDDEVRALRKKREAQDEIVQAAHAEIERARFAVRGSNGYPDATGTLRLSFGRVQGYEEDGQSVPPLTTFKGLFERAAQHQRREPFDLPLRWAERQAKIDPAVPFDFVSTAESVGGNSGSPVVNRAGEFVGVLFDGNLPTLAWTYAFDDTQARSVAVHSAGIIEALRSAYDADALVAELQQGRR